jgi:hypothetical protein
MVQYRSYLIDQRKQSDLQMFFLERLDRLLELRKQIGSSNAEAVRLVDRCTYSTYCDCLDLGIHGTVKEMIHGYREHLERQAVGIYSSR